MFEVGEIAIYQNLTRHPEYNGEECEIIKPLGKHKDASMPNIESYIVKDNSGVFWALPNELRKKKPPEASWEEIQSWAKWNPTKQGVEV